MYLRKYKWQVCVLSFLFTLIVWHVPNMRSAHAQTDTAAPAAVAAAAASDEPKPDPAGTATGNASNVMDASGTPFVVSEPAKDAPDYAAKKNASDDYKAQAEKEPLSVKLADAVGHNRVSINFLWVLLTGFLVMFMQSGFAMV